MERENASSVERSSSGRLYEEESEKKSRPPVKTFKTRTEMVRAKENEIVLVQELAAAL